MKNKIFLSQFKTKRIICFPEQTKYLITKDDLQFVTSTRIKNESADEMIDNKHRLNNYLKLQTHTDIRNEGNDILDEKTSIGYLSCETISKSKGESIDNL